MSQFLKLTMVLALAAPFMSGGGFFLTLGNADASSDPAAKGALLLVRPDGCQDPSKVKLVAVAEGLVDGKRHSIPLTIVPLAKDHTFAIKRTWPSQGVWVLNIRGLLPNLTATTLAPVTTKGLDRRGIKQLHRDARPDEIQAALMALGGS